jgi:hypothetical protein
MFAPAFQSFPDRCDGDDFFGAIGFHWILIPSSWISLDGFISGKGYNDPCSFIM